MTYETPTAANLKERYPAFASTSDQVVEMFLAEASSYVGSNWTEADYRLGMMSVAAHNLSSEGYGAAIQVPTPHAVLGASIKRRKVGDVETEYNVAAPSSGASLQSMLSSTPFGRTYLRLVRIYGAGPRAV